MTVGISEHRGGTYPPRLQGGGIGDFVFLFVVYNKVFIYLSIYVPKY